MAKKIAGESASNKHPTREGWLNDAIEAFRPIFASPGYKLPIFIRAATGFTSQGKAATLLSEVWHASKSAGGWYEIWISPTLADPVEILTELMARLLSTALPQVSRGYGPDYRAAMKKLEMGGHPSRPHLSKRQQTVINKMADDLGPFPHDVLNIARSPDKSPEMLVKLNGAAKQSTRHISYACPAQNCDFKGSFTQKALDIGVPFCPAHPDLEMVPSKPPQNKTDEISVSEGVRMPSTIPQEQRVRTPPAPSEPPTGKADNAEANTSVDAPTDSPMNRGVRTLPTLTVSATDQVDLAEANASMQAQADVSINEDKRARTLL